MGASAVLGFDTATPHLAVALLRGEEPLFESTVGPAEDGRPRHASRLLGELERAVEPVGGWGSVELLAVGIGPGAFTGLRIGIATARALAQAQSLPVVGVGSLAALAAGIDAPGRPRLAVLDARRGEAFALGCDAAAGAVWGPSALGPADLARRARELGGGAVAAGDGSLRFRAELEAAGVEVLAADDPAHRVPAREVCRLARDGQAGPLETLEPTYLRRPDAELWRERDRKHLA